MIVASFLLAISPDLAPERESLLRRWQGAGGAVPVRRRLQARPAIVPPVALLRALADGELSRRGRYVLSVAAEPKPNPSWWDRMWQWIGDRWRALWKALFGHVRLGRAAVTSIGDVAIAAIAMLLVVTASRLAQLRIKPGRRTRAPRRRAPLADANELDERAKALARAGAYAAAVRLLFAAMLAALDERGILRDDRSSTVGEVRRFLLGHKPALVGDFNDVASAFVTGVYAEDPVERGDWERARSAYQSFVGQASA
jgi:Domain of unknown function (DUF4129)